MLYLAALESDQFMYKGYSEEATKLTSIMNRLPYLHCVSHNSARQSTIQEFFHL